MESYRGVTGTITWESADKNVATVENGKITAVGTTGSTTITAKVEGTEYEATCKVSIVQKVTSITAKNVTVGKNQTAKIEVITTPTGLVEDLTYASETPSIATVAEDGTVTGVTTTEKTTAKKETTSSTEKTTEQKTQTSTNKPTQTTTKAPGRATIKTIKKGKRKAQLKWKKVSKAKGYMIQYSTSKKFKRSQTKTKYATKMNLMVKKLKSKKTYYFRMKAYTKGAANKKVYSKNWSKVKKCKI